MIVLEDISKWFPAPGGRHVLFEGVNLTIPSNTGVAILGRNGAGKSTLLDIISGVLQPDTGRVLTSGNISYPVGFSGAFHGQMTGVQAARFVARIYGADTDEVVEFTRDFTDLGRLLYQPIRTYSSGQKSRLSFAISMAIPFDTYLLDEVGAVGDINFKIKSNAVFEDRMRNAGIVMVAHGMGQVRKFCTQGAVIHRQSLYHYEDIEEAIAHYARINSNIGGRRGGGRLKRKNAETATKPATWVTRVVEGLTGRARTED
jgi:capsular polysaccharide transport system ATP-binding protein